MGNNWVSIPTIFVTEYIILNYNECIKYNNINSIIIHWDWMHGKILDEKWRRLDGQSAYITIIGTYSL